MTRDGCERNKIGEFGTLDVMLFWIGEREM